MTTLAPSSGYRQRVAAILQVVISVAGNPSPGHKWGNFGLWWCGWQTVGSAPDENRFTVFEQARRVYYGAVFKAKKEIPVNIMLTRTRN